MKMTKKETKIKNLQILIENVDQKLEKLKLQKELYQISLANLQRVQEEISRPTEEK